MLQDANYRLLKQEAFEKLIMKYIGKEFKSIRKELNCLKIINYKQTKTGYKIMKANAA